MRFRRTRRHYTAIVPGKHTARGMVLVWCSCGVNQPFDLSDQGKVDEALDLYNTHRTENAA